MRIIRYICLIMLVTFIANISSISLARATMNDEQAKFLIESTLSNSGIKDISLLVADGRPNSGEKVLILGYSSQATDLGELSAETAKILGGYLGAISSGWDGESLMVSVGDIRGEYAIGTWYCTKEWTSNYIIDNMTDEEILLNSLKTMSSV